MKIDLSPFCATKAHPSLQFPFSRGDWTYATNGHICVRVPRRTDVTAEGPDAERLFEGAYFGGLFPAVIPHIPEREKRKCLYCGGAGQEYDDYNCIYGLCEDCDGTGVVYDIMTIKVYDRLFNAEYIRLMSALPGLKIPFDCSNSNFTPLQFAFNGGQGLVMPMTGGPHGGFPPVTCRQAEGGAA